MVAVLTVEIFTYTGHIPPLPLRFTVLEPHLLWTGMHPPLTMNLLWNIQDVIISRAKLSLHWQNLHCQVTFEWHSGCGSEQGTLPISSSKHRTETTLTINSYASLHKLWTYCGAFKTCDFFMGLCHVHWPNVYFRVTLSDILGMVRNDKLEIIFSNWQKKRSLGSAWISFFDHAWWRTKNFEEGLFEDS